MDPAYPRCIFAIPELSTETARGICMACTFGVGYCLLFTSMACTVHYVSLRIAVDASHAYEIHQQGRFLWEGCFYRIFKAAWQDSIDLAYLILVASFCTVQYCSYANHVYSSQ